MSDSPLLEGVSSAVVTTARLKTHLLTSGDEQGVPVFFVHGNVSSPSSAQTREEGEQRRP